MCVRERERATERERERGRKRERKQERKRESGNQYADGVTTRSRLFKIIGLFFERAL